MMERDLDHVRAKKIALRLLAVRGWSRTELTARLIKRGAAPETAEAVVTELEREGLSGDTRYAAEVVALELSRRPAGDMLLEHKLVSRGVDEKLAGRVTREQTGGRSELSRAVELVERSRKAGKDLTTERRRLMGLLGRRGFDGETAREAIERVMGVVGQEAEHGGTED